MLNDEADSPRELRRVGAQLSEMPFQVDSEVRIIGRVFKRSPIPTGASPPPITIRSHPANLRAEPDVRFGYPWVVALDYWASMLGYAVSRRQVRSVRGGKADGEKLARP